MSENGAVWGYEDGTFGIKNEVTRAEFLKMLYAVKGLTGIGVGIELPFNDILDNTWYFAYLEEAYATNVINGYPDGTFRPDDFINQVEAMKIISNAFDVEYLYEKDEAYDFCFEDFSDDISIDTNEWYWPSVSVLDELCIISENNSVPGLTILLGKLLMFLIQMFLFHVLIWPTYL